MLKSHHGRRYLNGDDVEDWFSYVERLYNKKIAYEMLPNVFKNRLEYNSKKLSSAKGVSLYHMGYLEEVGDLTYQIFKLKAYGENMITPKSQKRLFEWVTDHGFTDARMQDIDELYDIAKALVDDKSIKKFKEKFDIDLFPEKEKTSLDFLSGQLVAYICRIKGDNGNYDDNKKVVHAIINSKIPEETAELCDVLCTNDPRLKGDKLLTDITSRLELAKVITEKSYNLLNATDPISLTDDYLHSLQAILNHRIDGNIGEALEFALFKYKGRQELNFRGFSYNETSSICKPAEFLLEHLIIT